MIPGSYANGFAPRDMEPEYPELWRGLVGSWCPSLGPTGEKLRDWSGLANHGSISATLSTAWSMSQGYSLLLDGVDDHVSVPDSSGFDFGAGHFTISMWAKVASLTHPRQMLAAKDNNGERQIIFDREGSGKLQIAYFKAGEVFVGQNTSVDPITDLNWHLYTAGKNASGFFVYQDSTLLPLDALSGTHGTMNSTTSNLTFGARQFSGAEDYFAGSIDDIAIYNRDSTAEISLRYSGGFGRAIAAAMRERRLVRAPAGGRLLQLRRACA